MNIKGTYPLAYGRKGSRTFITLYDRVYEHNGRESSYFMIGRGDTLVEHNLKMPDAVVVVATLNNPGQERKLVMTSEFRVPLGVREIGFVAGLIDPADYKAA